jgi:Raf kinase inhibitor-like YbhB/YbcL family protein
VPDGLPPALCRPRGGAAWRVAATLLALAALVLAGCQGDGDGAETGEPAGSLDVRSEAVADGGEVPVEHTCDGADVPPPLEWEGVPEEAREVAVIIDDPDAPEGTFTHWLVAGLPGGDGSLDPASDGAEGDGGLVEGVNDFGEGGWRGPCPPEGDGPHTYRFRVLALDAASGLEPGFDAGALQDAAGDAVVAEGVLEAAYER